MPTQPGHPSWVGKLVLDKVSAEHIKSAGL